jgi:phosphoribosylformylglycinamidine synthase subunit PurSL
MPQYLVTVTQRETPQAGQAVGTLYLLAGAALNDHAVEQLCAQLLHDPVVQQVGWQSIEALADRTALPALYAEVAYKPGVTDNEAESVLEGARRAGVSGLETVRTLRRYPLPEPEAAASLYNSLIQVALVARGPALAERTAWYRQLLHTPAPVTPRVARVELREADDETLLRISREGILALDLQEMQALRSYFQHLGRDPSDGELETIAQTWSEHCSHKTFKAKVRYREEAGSREQEAGGRKHETEADAALYPMLHMLEQSNNETLELDSLIKTFLMTATERVLAQHSELNTQHSPWVLSAFVDNAGIIAFTDEYEVSIKVETHNHPSALEPFGGANTGVGGVIRDVLGVSARPIANTDVLCFGLPDATNLAPGVIHPATVCAGVVAGVRDYGNKLGIPTVNGAVLFDEGYTANPLVFCGTVGIAPRGSNPHNVQPGDAVVVLGGRTGRDGIHGATFSSIELTDTTASEVGSAVQIGDPITEKKMLDVLLQARDAGLYSAITDCGAGGLSSAVGEMGEKTGAAVQLELVSLKYPGLQPWEIWLSEAQERMVLAVPPHSLAAFQATAIGTFTNDQTLTVTHHGATVVELSMAFLHGGRPQRVLEAVWATDDRRPATHETEGPGGPQHSQETTPLIEQASALQALLADPNIASKERIIRTYDHEIGGATVIKPLVGVRSEGPGDAAVLQPLPHTNEGLALGCGINPNLGRIDPYWMALAAIDEALRNVVAVGGDPGRTVILDNFCWGDPKQPDRMAGLVRAAAGCYDAALAFGTPFVSGKDSLNNEYRDSSGTRVAIPPTLLITALAYTPDVTRSVTMDLKAAGNTIYLVGETRNELAGSFMQKHTQFSIEHAAFPRVDLAAAKRTFAALHTAIQAGLVRACHDLSEGGLAVAAAEMVIAGELGLELDLNGLQLDPFSALYAETPSRFLVEVDPAKAAALEEHLAGVVVTKIGTVSATPHLHVQARGETLIDSDINVLKTAWHSGLDKVSL